MDDESIRNAMEQVSRARDKRQSIRAVLIVLALIGFGIAVAIYGRMSGMR